MSQQIENKYIKADTPAPFDTVGLFTFLRTYARRHDENDANSTIETWEETLNRVIRACENQLHVGFTKEEEKELFGLLYNLKCSVAGRFLWQLGTKTVDRLGLPSLENCAFEVINKPVTPFTWAMNFLMLGCIPPDTPVLTETGHKAIKNIRVGEKVWSYNIKSDKNELKEVMKLHDPVITKEENIKITSLKSSFITSKKHPILVRRKGEWDYVLAGDLKKGDILKLYCSEVEEKIVFNEKAWLLGAFLGDGTTNITPFGSRRIRIAKDNENVVKQFASILQKLSGVKTNYNVYDRKEYKVPMWNLEKTISPNDSEFIEKWEEFTELPEGKKTYDVDIPSWIYKENSKNTFMSFLCGLVDTDGTISGSKVTISTSSEKMSQSLYKASRLFGLEPWTRTNDCKRYNELREIRGTGYRYTCDNYCVTFRSLDFRSYLDFFQNSAKKEKICVHLFKKREKQFSNKTLIVPEDLAKQEAEYLELDKTRYHFLKKIKDTGYIGSGYYESRSKSFEHLLQYDMITEIENNLDIPPEWKDITVEDNNNYYMGEGALAVSHNSGIGFRILPEDIKQLPIVNYALNVRKDSKDADYIVPDSREGWVKLLGKVLKSHFYSGKAFTYSCLLLRSKGAPIKGFGGLASGPEVLCEGMAKIDEVLNKRAGQFLRPIDALDIMCIIGMIVVSGNVRRCLPKDSLVHTEEGLIPIQNVEVGKNVLTMSGYKKVSNKFVQGKQKLVKIVTEDGSEFLCTPNHRMAIYDREDKEPRMIFDIPYKWKEAGKLDSEDYLIPAMESTGGVEVKYPSQGGERQVQFSRESAQLFGLLQTYNRIYPAQQLLVFDKNQSGLSDFVYDNLHFFTGRLVMREYKDDTVLVRCADEKLFSYYNTSIKSEKIPGCFLIATPEVKLGYISGCMIGMPVDKDTNYTTNKDFALSLQVLALSVGLRLTIKEENNKYYFSFPQPLGNGDEACKMGVKVERVEEVKEEQETYDIEVEDVHEFFCNGFLTHNSALIAIGDCKDTEYLRAKRWDLGNIPNHRAFSNNSVVCNDVKDILNNEDFWHGYLGNGEPYGLINLNLSRSCGRIGEVKYSDSSVDGYNPCLSGDTLIGVADGRGAVKISELAKEGKDVPVYSLNRETGEISIKWGRQPRITGENKKLIRVHFRAGTHKAGYIDVTPNHKFPTNTGQTIEAAELKIGESIPVFKRGQNEKDGYILINVNNGTKETKTEHRMIMDFFDPSFKQRVIDGVINGCCNTGNIVVHHKDHNKLNNSIENLEIMTFEEHDRLHGLELTGKNNPMYGREHKQETKDLIGLKSKERWTDPEFREKWNKSLTDENREKFSKNMSKWRIPFEIERQRGYEETALKEGYNTRWINDTHFVVVKNCEVCEEEFELDFKDREQPNCSTYCGNRSKKAIENRTQANRIIRNNNAKENFHSQVMIYKNLQEEKGDIPVLKKEWEQECKRQGVRYRFQTSTPNPFIARNWGDFKKRADEYNHRVSKIEELPGEHTVYNITVDDNHTIPIVTKINGNNYSGIFVMNCGEMSLSCAEVCCLGELFLPNISSQEELYKCATYVYRICKHSLTLPCQISEETERIVHKNMRIGLGVTGYLQATEEQKGWLDDCYKYLREYDKKYSISHGFPTSIKLTTCKPSGCARKDMLIQTNKGLLRLDEIGDVNGAEWQDVNGLFVRGDDKNGRKYYPINKFYRNGFVRTKKVILQSGLELEVSLNHRFGVWDMENKDYYWKYVTDLRSGDLITTMLGGQHTFDADCRITSEQAYNIGKETKKSVPKEIRTAPVGIIRSFLAGVASQRVEKNSQGFRDLRKVQEISQEVQEISQEVQESQEMSQTSTILSCESYSLIQELLVLCRSLSLNPEIIKEGDTYGLINRGSKSKIIFDPVLQITDSFCDTYDIEVNEIHHYRMGGTISHNTLSLLAGVSPGIHPCFDRYYIRRIRVSADSKLLETLRTHGYHIEPTINFDGSLNHGTQVVSFPYRVPDNAILANECSAVKQLEFVKRLQTEWSDNSVSVTVYYRPGEIEEIKEYLKENYNNSIKTVSFLLHSEHGFLQAPMESITKEQYEEMVAKCRPIIDLNNICYTAESDELLAQNECAGGHCPLK